MNTIHIIYGQHVPIILNEMDHPRNHRLCHIKASQLERQFQCAKSASIEMKSDKLSNMVLHKLKKLEYLSDITLISCDGVRFAMHKAILADNCGFFHNAFQDLAVNHTFKLEETADVLTAVISQLYCSCEPHELITADNVQVMVKVFSKYDMPPRSKACDNFLVESVKLSNASLPGWITFAIRYDMSSFLQKCNDHAVGHMSELIHMDGADEWIEDLTAAELVKLLK